MRIERVETQEKKVLRRNILLKTNLLICIVVVVGFLITAVVSYHNSYDQSVEKVRQVSELASENVYQEMRSILAKPVNISLTMANDSLLEDLMKEEKQEPEDQKTTDAIQEYLSNYQKIYNYDSVFLVSTATNRYYNFEGIDRVLTKDNEENVWYYDILASDDEYQLNVDNDEVQAANNEIAVFVNCKIRDEKGRTLAVVGVGIHVDNLRDKLKEYEEEFDVNT